MLRRYVVYQVCVTDDRYIDFAYTLAKAYEIANTYTYECMNQDKSFIPDIKIVEEVLEEEYKEKEYGKRRDHS